ncbi:hypothetical protein SH2C18_39620 [Clostridium sediminicola]
MSFWAKYVLLKEKQGQTREVTLQKIGDKFGLGKRQEIEQKLDSQ